MFSTCSLPTVLRTITTFTFSTSQLPKAIRTRGALTVVTSICASLHNRRPLFRHRNFQSPPNPVCFVHFHFQTCFAPQRRAIFHLSCPDVSAPAALASLLFDPPDTTQSKNTVLRDFPTFSRTRIFYLLTLSLSDLLHLLSSPFCLSPCPSIVGSLTSKLPSTIAVSLAI